MAVCLDIECKHCGNHDKVSAPNALTATGWLERKGWGWLVVGKNRKWFCRECDSIACEDVV